MKKLISVVVIFLFIGLAFAPSINANVGEKELVEFTTEVYGLNGGKQTVKLTQNEADEVEALFDLIREQLNTTESRVDTEEIFKDAVVELDKYGLLGGLSIKQAQNLITEKLNKSDRLSNYNRIKKINMINEDNNSNFLCLIAGYSTQTFFANALFSKFLLYLARYGLFVNILQWANNNGYEKLYKFLENIWFFLYLDLWIILFIWPMIFTHICPFSLVNNIFLGSRNENHPASGWIFTNGMNGKITWNGDFYGDLPKKPFILTGLGEGVYDFTGLKIVIPNFDEYRLEPFYLGVAVWVKIK